MTLAALLAGRAEDAGVVFLGARDDRVVRWRDLAVAAAGWQAALEADPGTVALAAADPLDFATAYVGLLAAGATVAPLEPGLSAERLAKDLAALGATALVGDVGHRDVGHGDVGHRDVGHHDVGHRDVPVLRPETGARLDPDGPPGRVLLRSSGTTGPRKHLVLTEAQLLHTAGAVARHHRLGPGERGLCPLPLFHVNAEVVGLLATVVAGAQLVLDDRFHRDLWDVAARHEVTWLNAVPAIVAILAQGECGAPPPSVRFVRSASAPLPVPVLERFEALTGLPVVETYGMTEAASQICANPLDGPRKPGSVGLPVQTGLRIVGDDDDGDDGVVAPGMVGRVQIRGAGVVAGPLPGGWLDTGDLGRRDADGYVFLTGRVDDVINRGGEKVFPGEVEAELLGDPRVVEAVVVAAPHDVLGAVPVAYVVPRPESLPESLAADLLARAAAGLDRVRRPVRVTVVPALPRGVTGKVSRAAIRAAAADLDAGALQEARA